MDARAEGHVLVRLTPEIKLSSPVPVTWVRVMPRAQKDVNEPR
jgi:hypothetical protein